MVVLGPPETYCYGSDGERGSAGNTRSGKRKRVRVVTVTRIDARLAGHALDSGVEPDPILDVPLMISFGAAAPSATKMNMNGPSVIRVPDWVPDAQKTHPDAVYYMYYADHGGRDIRLAWSAAITGKWHLFNRGKATDRAWGVKGNNTGARTPGEGVLDLNVVGRDDAIHVDEDFGLRGHIASPDVHVDDVNRRIVMYFHGPQRAGFGAGTGTFVATSRYGLNFNMPKEGGEKGHGVRNVVVAAQYLKTFEVAGQKDGKKVKKTFGFVNGSGLWEAPTFTAAGEIASHANGDSEGGFWNPTGPGDPTPPGRGRYWWKQHKSWTEENPYSGTIKAPELVPPELKAKRNKTRLVRGHGNGPRHFAIYHNPKKDRNRIYVFYSARRDLPESIVYIVFDLAGLSESDRLNPALWKRVSDVERVVMKPAMVWEGVELPYKASVSGGATNKHELRDPDILEDIDGKVYMFYTGKAEGAIGVARLNIEEKDVEDSIRVTFPFRGSTALVGRTRNIAWTNVGDTAKVDLEYTVNGKEWISIAKGVDNKNYHPWTIPDTPCDAARLRVRESGGKLVGESGGFMIATDKSLFVVRPERAAKVLAGARYGLTWASVGEISKVTLEYTIDGTRWVAIAAGVANTMAHTWEVPNAPSSTVRIRVKETGGEIVAVSDAFSIVAKGE